MEKINTRKIGKELSRARDTVLEYMRINPAIKPKDVSLRLKTAGYNVKRGTVSGWLCDERKRLARPQTVPKISILEVAHGIMPMSLEERVKKAVANIDLYLKTALVSDLDTKLDISGTEYLASQRVLLVSLLAHNSW